MGVKRKPRGRSSLLLLTAGSALAAAVGNAVGLSAQPLEPLPVQSRLGAAIADDANVRDRAAARRGRTLDLREQAVRAAEARLKSSDAAKADEAAQNAAPANGPPPPSQYDDLAKIYAAMKPAAAAAVMEQLDLEVQMRVAQKMRERSIAAIMAAMSPRGAAALTMALARKQASAAAGANRSRPGIPAAAAGGAAAAPTGAAPPRDRRAS